MSASNDFMIDLLALQNGSGTCSFGQISSE
jgi:hypothetical protein